MTASFPKATLPTNSLPSFRAWRKPNRRLTRTSFICAAYHLLNNKQLDYQELGGSYFDTLDPSRLRRHLVKCLESLGDEVTLAERNAA